MKTTRTILVAGKDKAFSESIQFYLGEKRNYLVKTVFNMKKALACLTGEQVDLIVIDVRMPELDSIQFMIELFNNSVCKPLIVLKRHNGADYWEKTEVLKKLGIVEYIDKPIDLEKLDESIVSVHDYFTQYKDVLSCNTFMIALSMIRVEKQTGVLTVTTKKKEGQLFIDKGETVDIAVEGVAANLFLEKCLRAKKSDIQIQFDHLEHDRQGNSNSLYAEMLSDKMLSARLYYLGKTNKEAKMAVNEKVFDGLSAISGFVAGAVYYGDGELITEKMIGEMNPGKMGGLAIELYKAATSIVDKMGLGNANFVQVHTDEYTFIHTCIVPGIAALGVIVKNSGNIGLMKHEMSGIVKQLKPEFGG